LHSPIPRGFNPDPSICRVGPGSFIATSTCEGSAGVQIHRPTDPVNWTLVARPLRRAARLDLRGHPDSCGVRAPCLSHAEVRFWLVHTDVKRLKGAFKEAHNAIVTCETVAGEWSDPVHVTVSGVDLSLFHEDDGRTWFVDMRWNHRGAGTGGNPAHDRFDETEVQDWHLARGHTPVARKPRSGPIRPTGNARWV